MRHTVFFDLDGTLLPLDTHSFFTEYMSAVKKSGALDRIDKKNGEEIFGKAIYAMLGNDGKKLNKDVFFAALKQMAGVGIDEVMPHFDRFYQDGFMRTQKHTRTESRVRQTIDTLKQKGYRLVLATNPLFPPIATNQRIEWAGLSPDDFEYVSYYDNSSWCKPSPQYFLEILEVVGLSADECYMVGNDIKDDMDALALGFEGFLVLDHVIGDPERIPQCKQGDYSALLDFAKKSAAGLKADYYIIGLGNPGGKYAHTRHNAGFDVVDILSQRHGVSVRIHAYKARLGKGKIGGKIVVLAMPQTYMNKSGESLKEMAGALGISAKQLIVVYDDVDLKQGTVRIKAKGSAGTHNGMRSVIYSLQTDEFTRVRVGVGRPDGDIIDHVLGEYTDKQEAYDTLCKAADAIEAIVEYGVYEAQNRFN